MRAKFVHPRRTSGAVPGKAQDGGLLKGLIRELRPRPHSPPAKVPGRWLANGNKMAAEAAHRDGLLEEDQGELLMRQGQRPDTWPSSPEFSPAVSSTVFVC